MSEAQLPSEVYAHLRAVAARIHHERTGGNASIRPTELLHEAWMKVERGQMEFASRTHFLRVAAKAMRQILVDRARTAGRQKRGGDRRQTTLTGLSGEPDDVVDVLALDDALSALKEVDPTAEELVVLRVFGGLTVPEAAESLGMSPRKVNYVWRFARAFLSRRLDE